MDMCKSTVQQTIKECTNIIGTNEENQLNCHFATLGRNLQQKFSQSTTYSNTLTVKHTNFGAALITTKQL